MTKPNHFGIDGGAHDVLDLLGDESVRVIISMASDEPVSVSEISRQSDIPKATIYRKVEALKALGLLEDGSRVREDGYHDTVYFATVSRLSIVMEGGKFEMSYENRSEDIADRLYQLWGDF